MKKVLGLILLFVSWHSFATDDDIYLSHCGTIQGTAYLECPSLLSECTLTFQKGGLSEYKGRLDIGDNLFRQQAHSYFNISKIHPLLPENSLKFLKEPLMARALR